MKAHAKETLLIIAVLIILIVIFTFPAILHLSNLLIGDGGDNYEYFSFQFIAAQKLKALEWPFTHTDIIRYPVGFNFGAGFESVITVLTGAVFSLFINNILAYNLTVLFLYFLNGLTSFILFKHISKSNLTAFIGSIIYGFSFFAIARSAGHINLFFLGGFILLIYSFIRLKELISTKNILIFYAACELVLLGSFIYVIEFTVALLLCLLLTLLFYKNELKTVLENIYRERNKFLQLSIPFIIIAIIFSYPHIIALVTGDFNRPLRNDYNSMFYASPSIKDYILPNAYLPLQITNLTKSLNDSVKGIDKAVFLGWLEIGLFICFLLFYKNKRLKYFLATGTSIFFILTLGYLIPGTKIYLPYYYIHKLPLFSFIDEPSRFYPVMYLFITFGVILFLVQIYRKNAKSLLIFLAIAFLLVLERLPLNYWLTPTYKDQAWVQEVAKQDTTAVLDIPVSYTNSPYHLLPYIYSKKIVAGTFQWFADTDQTKSFIVNNLLTRFMCGASPKIDSNTPYDNNDLIQVLKNYEINTIVVHKNDTQDSAKFYFPECANMRMQTTLFLPQLMEPNATGKVEILSLFSPATPGLGDTITFPSDGTFTIQGMQASPREWLPLHLYLNGKEIDFKQQWKNSGAKDALLEPNFMFEASKGSKMTFLFDKNQNMDYSFVKIWYVYKTVGNTQELDSTGQIIKIYEDDNAAVFKLN